jgi:hypothetical protein
MQNIYVITDARAILRDFCVVGNAKKEEILIKVG